MSGWQNKAFANATLILQPPENILLGQFCISDEKPSPFDNQFLFFFLRKQEFRHAQFFLPDNIELARDSAVSESISCNLWWTHCNLKDWSLVVSFKEANSFSSFNNFSRSTSHSKIDRMQGVSSPLTSWKSKK